eukprot:2876703-Prymnesium_polylepis.1
MLFEDGWWNVTVVAVPNGAGPHEVYCANFEQSHHIEAASLRPPWVFDGGASLWRYVLQRTGTYTCSLQPAATALAETAPEVSDTAEPLGAGPVLDLAQAIDLTEAGDGGPAVEAPAEAATSSVEAPGDAEGSSMEVEAPAASARKAPVTSAGTVAEQPVPGCEPAEVGRYTLAQLT